MEFVIGAIGAVVVMILFCLSVFLGWKLKEYQTRHEIQKTAKELSEAELRKVKDEQEAWKAMNNYSVEDAYGLKGDHDWKE